MDPTNIDLSTILTGLGALIGTALAAFGIRMGWKNGGKETIMPTDSAEIKTAIVDSSSIKLLAGSIEGVGVYILEFRKYLKDNDEEVAKRADQLVEALRGVQQELRELTRETRELAREVSKNRG